MLFHKRAAAALPHADTLTVSGLSVDIRSQGKVCPALTDVSFTLHAGEIVGLVGESGCGKSLTSLSLLGLLPAAATVRQGQILLGDTDLARLSEADWCRYRGRRIAMIFQDPMSALDPLVRVGRQIEEAYRVHHPAAPAADARRMALEMMQSAGLPHPEELYSQYPNQLSGGMKQRVMIAMALINHPDVIIADEPTTALDVTIQAQILELLQTLSRAFRPMILLISHDLGVIRQVCDRTLIMYGGRILEQGPVDTLLDDPRHPYTRGLLASVPDADHKDRPVACIPGFVESLEQRRPRGCPFAGRCALADDRCRADCPPLTSADGRTIRCYHWEG